jgi:hypothetical protein
LQLLSPHLALASVTNVKVYSIGLKTQTAISEKIEAPFLQKACISKN